MERNEPQILCEGADIQIHPTCRFGRNVVFGRNCRRVRIGFGGFIGNDVYIDVEDLDIGDYFTLHHGSVVHGVTCRIGHNCWIGHYTILDAHGGLLRIGNNVGVGAHSQLWSHMKFGDRMAGCRWYRMESLDIGDDAWFVGHCIVTPIRAEPRAMLMVGGVAVRDMAANHVYAGSPAKDMTDRFGPQFDDPPLEEKVKRFEAFLQEAREAGIDTGFVRQVADLDDAAAEPGTTAFCVATRQYAPRYADDEHRLMRFLLYDRAKFVPR